MAKNRSRDVDLDDEYTFSKVRYGKKFEEDKKFRNILNDTSIGTPVNITNKHSNINSLAAVIEKSRVDTLNDLKGISASVASTSKSQQKLVSQIKMKELSSNKQLKLLEKSTQEVLGKLGYAVDEIARGTKRMIHSTALATKESIKEYGRALNDDFGINKANFLSMTLAKASPVFGYFAGKFMETSVFSKFSNLIREKFSTAITFVANKFKDIFGRVKARVSRLYKGKDEVIIPKMATGGYVKKTGLAKVHAAEIVAPLDKLGFELKEALEPTRISIVNELISLKETIISSISSLGTNLEGAFSISAFKQGIPGSKFIYNAQMGMHAIRKGATYFLGKRNKYSTMLSKSPNVTERTSDNIGILFTQSMVKFDSIIDRLGQLIRGLLKEEPKDRKYKTWTKSSEIKKLGLWKGLFSPSLSTDMKDRHITKKTETAKDRLSNIKDIRKEKKKTRLEIVREMRKEKKENVKSEKTISLLERIKKSSDKTAESTTGMSKKLRKGFSSIVNWVIIGISFIKSLISSITSIGKNIFNTIKDLLLGRAILKGGGGVEIPTPGRKGKTKLPKAKGGFMKKAGMVGTAYGAYSGITGGMEGYSKAGEMGVSKGAGAVGGALSFGSIEGGISGAFQGGILGASIGGTVGGPWGIAIGALAGAILGGIGGKRISKFIDKVVSYFEKIVDFIVKLKEMGPVGIIKSLWSSITSSFSKEKTTESEKVAPIQKYDKGGVVPDVGKGLDGKGGQLAIVHSGEQIIPRHLVEKSKKSELLPKEFVTSSTRPDLLSMLKDSLGLLDIGRSITSGVIDFGKMIGRGIKESLGPTSGFGWLTRMFESGGAGASAIGWDRTGGHSYGYYQLAEKQGSVAEFLSNNPNIQSKFQGLTIGTPQFNERWKQLGNTDEGFRQAQHEFIKQKYFQPYINKIKERTGIDLKSKHPVVGESILSTAVQYGPNSSVIPNALKGMTGREKDEDILKKIGQYKYENVYSNFRSSTPEVQKAVSNRILRETSVALGALGLGEGVNPFSLPKAKEGGFISKSGPIYAHEGEVIGPITQVKDTIIKAFTDPKTIAKIGVDKDVLAARLMSESSNDFKRTALDSFKQQSENSNQLLNNVGNTFSTSISNLSNNLGGMSKSNNDSDQDIMKILKADL